MEEKPHPLVAIWLGINHWSTAQQHVLPWSGGWLDWDLAESKGMLWLEELVKELRNTADNRARAKEEGKYFMGM